MVFIFVINRNFKMQFEINLKRKNKNKIYGKGAILNNSLRRRQIVWEEDQNSNILMTKKVNLKQNFRK